MQSWIHVHRVAGHRAPGDDRAGRRPGRGATPTPELRAEVERARAAGPALGIGPGDVVAIVAKNSADFLVHAFALHAGGRHARRSSTGGCRPRELAEVLALVEPAAIAADAEFTALVDAAMPGPPCGS